MSFITNNPLTIPEIESPPAAPIEGARGLFAGEDGWYDINSNNDVSKIVTETEVFEERPFSWTDFDFSYEGYDVAPLYTDNSIGGIGEFIIYCAGQTISFDVSNPDLSEYNKSNNWIVINGEKYIDTSFLSIPLTYMETDIIVHADMAAYYFTNMIQKMMKGIPVVDASLSHSSTNPVQNKVIAKELNDLNANLQVSVPDYESPSSSFSWTEFEIDTLNDYDSIDWVYVYPGEISVGGMEGIVIRCAGKALGFTYSVSGCSDASITINGETTTYTYSGSNIEPIQMATNVEVPLTCMESDIIIRGGMTNWIFDFMKQQPVKDAPVKDIVANLNSNIIEMDDKLNNTYTKTETDIAIANAGHLTRAIVEVLPEIGDEHTIYMVLDNNSTTENIYREYMYLNSTWEQIGSSSVNLSDYVKNTDYATKDTAGVVKINGDYGIYIGDGVLKLNTASNANIDNRYGLGVIVASNVEYAVKSIGDGYYAKEADVGSINDALLTIRALQDELIGGVG